MQAYEKTLQGEQTKPTSYRSSDTKEAPESKEYQRWQGKEVGSSLALPGGWGLVKGVGTGLVGGAAIAVTGTVCGLAFSYIGRRAGKDSFRKTYIGSTLFVVCCVAVSRESFPTLLG